MLQEVQKGQTLQQITQGGQRTVHNAQHQWIFISKIPVNLIRHSIQCLLNLGEGIVQHCKAAGAADVRIAVLTEKLLANHTPAIAADYVALQVPDRYVFGYGMDYEDHWRNAPGIFACK